LFHSAWAKLFAAPVCLPALWERKVGFWACSDLTFGLNLTAAAAFAGEELSCLPQIEVLPADALLDEQRLVWQADLRQVSSRELQHVTNDALEFNISASAPQTGSGSASQTAQTEAASGGGAADVTGVGGSKRLALHGIALWFAVGGPSASSSTSTRAPPRTSRRQKRPLGVAGDGPRTHTHTHTLTDAEAHTHTHGQAHANTYTLATGPMDPETHWKQTIIALPHPLPLRADVTRLHCGLSLRRAEHRQVAARLYKLVAL
jgi:hypothetical protein